VVVWLCKTEDCDRRNKVVAKSGTPWCPACGEMLAYLESTTEAFDEVSGALE
jgi:hypothetical protein